MRYIAKWANGVWTTFDRLDYKPFQTHDTEKGAVAHAEWCNQQAGAK